MTKNILFTFIGLFLALHIGAQETSVKEKIIVTLNDGSRYVGDLISENKYVLEIEILTGDKIAIDKRFTKKIYSTNRNILIHENGKYHHTKGFFWGMHFGFNFFSEDRPSTHLNVLMGHRFSKHFSAAAGYAFEYNRAIVSGFTYDTQFSTLYAYGRYYLSHKKKRIFVYSRIGYGAPAEDNETEQEHSGGWQVQYGSGIHFASYKRSRFILSLGHHYQKTTGKESFIDAFGNEVVTNFDILISRPVISVAFELK